MRRRRQGPNSSTLSLSVFSWEGFAWAKICISKGRQLATGRTLNRQRRWQRNAIVASAYCAMLLAKGERKRKRERLRWPSKRTGGALERVICARHQLALQLTQPLQLSLNKEARDREEGKEIRKKEEPSFKLSLARCRECASRRRRRMRHLGRVKRPPAGSLQVDLSLS